MYKKIKKVLIFCLTFVLLNSMFFVASASDEFKDTGVIKFKYNGNEIDIQVDNLDVTIDELIRKEIDSGRINHLALYEPGGGFSKRYLLFWSNKDKFLNNRGKVTDGAIGYYGHETIRTAFPNGIPTNPEKAVLNAIYVDVNTAFSARNSLSGDISLNEGIDDSELMYDNFSVVEDKVYAIKNEMEEKYPIKLGAHFKLNPFVNSWVRWSPEHFFKPGSLQYYGKRGDDRISTSPDINKTEYTFIDLHVKVDPRIEISSNLKFQFKSYSFKPWMILKKDYTKFDNVVINVRDNDPVSEIEFDTAGEKEFLIRTVMRGIGEIPNSSFQEANLTDMAVITSSQDNFKVSKDTILDIGLGKQKPLEVGGEIKGGAFLYSFLFFGGPTEIAKKQAKSLGISFRPLLVEFNLNSDGLVASQQRLGAVKVAQGASIKDDIFDGLTLPAYDENNPASEVIGEAMPNNPSIAGYEFMGWNEMIDGSGAEFTENTVINEDKVVFAKWGARIEFNKNSKNLNDNSNQLLANVLFHVGSPYSSNVNAIVIPTLNGYIFKGYNSMSDGSGEVFDLATNVTNAKTFYAQWEKDPNPPVNPIPINPVTTKEVNALPKTGTALNTGLVLLGVGILVTGAYIAVKAYQNQECKKIESKQD